MLINNINDIKNSEVSEKQKNMLYLQLFILIIIVISLILKIEIEYIVVNISIFLVAALKIFPIVINLLKNVSKINFF